MTIDLILFPDILSDEIVSSRWNTSQSIRLIQTVMTLRQESNLSIYSLATVKLFEHGKRNFKPLSFKCIAYNISIIIDGSTVPKLIISGKFKQEEEEEEVIELALSSSFLYFGSSSIYLVASERIDIRFIRERYIYIRMYLIFRSIP
jgi:hypothetical protein